MQFIKRVEEFFEKMDVVVYVADIDTDELMYVNQRLRDSLEFKSHEDYRHKKCHESLQGCAIPCEFCTNEMLKENTFVSWVHKNTLLNKRFLVKDTVVHEQGHRYRFEIAIDIDEVDPQLSSESPYFYVHSESILNECLRQTFSNTDPEKSLQNILSYIGKIFSCDRVYVFELRDENVIKNTYEWCQDGIEQQKELLQSVPLSAVDWWLSLFEKDEILVIHDLEEIRTQHPESYAILKPQGITSLAAGPIKLEGSTIGFLGVDNPEKKRMPMVEPLLHMIGYFTSSLLKRRDLINRLNELSFHDQLTGALNRHALAERYGHLNMESVGVIYCDISGLKRINDSLGHEAGDRAICHCYDMICRAVKTDLVYRAGGDEFIALCPNVSREAFHKEVKNLRELIRQDDIHIAIGYIWSDEQPLDLEQLTTKADKVMYADKQEYYRSRNELFNTGRAQLEQDQQGNLQEPSLFQNFLATAHCDVESLFQSISKDNNSSYFYWGDMQKNLFYISDNMRDDFGFQSNVVYDLLCIWAKRISTPEFQDIYWEDISRIFREKRTLHDLRYRVRDVHGNNQWVRCYGILKWNEDKSAPIFFSGRVTHQDKNFVVDPLSTFPREQASFSQLTELQESGEQTWIIGFSINGISEINSTKGRAYGDRLFQKVAYNLLEKLSWKMSFYRLEGMRCMAIVNPICQSEGVEALTDQIRSVAQECYKEMGITVQTVCSFGVIEYPHDDFTPEDLVETLISLIRLAKQDAIQEYVDYSTENIQRIRKMSNMTLAITQDVHNNMEHFRIVVQPVVSAGDGKAIGGEVLMRWTFEGKDVSPAVFVPILEKESLIHAAGRWVFEQAVCTCGRIRVYNTSFYLTFNVSLHQLTDTYFLEFMKQTLEKYQVKGSNLVAELTESCLDEQPDRLEHFVKECQKMGLYIALDDFGSGYSSLRMLLQYPSSIIKLDRTLVQEVTESEEKMNFIRSIVYACHQFGKVVCMEGVEQEEQKEIILDTGCDLIQGYYYYRPMELSALYQMLSSSEPNE